jgi:hypothetical protein
MNQKAKITATAIALILSAVLGVTNLTQELPKNPNGREYKIRSLDQPFYITLHHTASKGQTLKQIARGHIQRGFPEIGYFAAINYKGEIFQLNDINEISWHDSGENTRSIGIVFVGNYQEKELPDAAYNSAKKLINELSNCLNIIGVRYHGQTSATLCPGKYAIEKIKPLLR